MLKSFLHPGKKATYSTPQIPSDPDPHEDFCPDPDPQRKNGESETLELTQQKTTMNISSP